MLSHQPPIQRPNVYAIQHPNIYITKSKPIEIFSLVDIGPKWA